MSGIAHVLQVFTIGVYGFTADAFFRSLASAEIDTFCDIRLRRGVRGSEYAFANSIRLQSALAERGIRYAHLLDLAPSVEVRQRQYAADLETRTGKRDRTQLSADFVDAYRELCLKSFDTAEFLEKMGDAKRIVLFCVERDPAACHRSLVAERLEKDLSISVMHLVP